MDSASYVCQLCKSKLTVTGNFDFICDYALRGPAQSGVLDVANLEESFIVLDAKRQAGRSLDDSFVLLNPSKPSNVHGFNENNVDAQGLDIKLQAMNKLFELASSASQIDQPLCTDCSSQLSSEMETQIQETQKEIEAYERALSRLEKSASAETRRKGKQAKREKRTLLAETPNNPNVSVTNSLNGTVNAIETKPNSSHLPSNPLLPSSPPLASLSKTIPAVSPLLSAEAFEREMQRLDQETHLEDEQTAALERELLAAQRVASHLAAAAADLDVLEDRYWHDFNAYVQDLRVLAEERDAAKVKADRSAQRLQLLRLSNVYDDVFRIWHQGPFGTISGFRLGRVPEFPVEWDEINAAWGQAVMLLHAMAQSVSLQFSRYRLLPMGSHSRIADKQGVLDLFGPVSKLWSGAYDRAMMAFLACLQEFGEFARQRDVQEGRNPPFQFPFAIDGDRVGQQSIKMPFVGQDARWTQALKLMLADLKVGLQWVVRREATREAAAAPVLRTRFA
mmetsp:Transcript_8755/g.16594  ORF Transcript_8755/g.16594 Transcript_8755/m.16594 type:complete len:507 (-) Transcript_8755:318-1838(-)